ncbi:uncharacterized protein LOC142327878 [Lycorma delicatula]|uniref:uncharacterized protein LOC142327878 n=1 Tax=Lycorma delicatula TaxID=130591 RepID=UPI003F514F37
MSVKKNECLCPKRNTKTYSETACVWNLATELYNCVEDGDLKKLMTLLVNEGANPNVVLPEYGVAPMHLAAGLEDIKFGCDSTKLFLCHGGNPNVQSNDGLTPVHIASLWGRSKVLKLLLASGGDPWLCDNEKKNAFCHAHDQKHWETFRVLDNFKNSYVFEQPDSTTKKKYKLSLERVKVFNNDVYAEYQAMPLTVKCSSTQTPPMFNKYELQLESTSLLKKETAVENSSIVPNFSNNASVNKNNVLTDTYDLKFNSCPDKQELQVLELVRKHRQGITVFEYFPDTDYEADDECISAYHEGNGRSSCDNVTINGSLNSLVKGSVFADVKSKLKLFYKNMNSSNKNCSSSNNGGSNNKDRIWRLNLIQKRKEKEKLRKGVKESPKSTYCENINSYSVNKSRETCSEFDCVSSKLSYVDRHVDKCSEVSGKSKNERKHNDSESTSSKKSCSIASHHRNENLSKNKKTNSKFENNYAETFHRFEDVIDSYTLDSMKNDGKIENLNSKLNTEVLNGNKIDSDKDITAFIRENIFADILQRINSNDNCNNENEIGFVVDNLVKDDKYLKKDPDSIPNNRYKRDIGFIYGDSLSSFQNIRGCNTQPAIGIDIASGQEEKNCQQNDTTLSSNGLSKSKSDCDDNKFDSCSAILTDDDSMNAPKFICHKSENTLDNDKKYITYSFDKINISNLNNSETSTNERFFSCTSVDVSKIIPENDGMEDSNLDDSNNILNNKISEKHIADITVYETDNYDCSVTDEKIDKEESPKRCFNNSRCAVCVNISNKEEVYESDYNDSITAATSSPKASVLLSEIYESTTSIYSEDSINCSNKDSSCGDGKALQVFEHHLNAVENNEELVPRIDIPCDLSSSDNNAISCSSTDRSAKINRIEKKVECKWTYADVLSSDEDTDFSIIEEYLYTDEDNGIELVEERHIPVRELQKEKNYVRSIIPSHVHSDKLLPQKNTDSFVSAPSSGTESESAVSSVDIAYETDALRRELKEYGFNSGPITGTTKKVYLRQLKRVRRKPIFVRSSSPRIEYSPELERLLRTKNKDLIESWSHLEAQMCEPFHCPDPNKRWREGVLKTSFTYLLLDPRVTQDLPFRANSLTPKEKLMCFLEAIFYVGRGKLSRPYFHLFEALDVWNHWKTVSSKKVNKILDVWGSGLGVICLQIFHNVIPAEAMTREAAMIDALGLQMLCNERVGDYYATASTWNLRQRQQLGSVLLVRALNILLNEGERQIRPRDISQSFG